MSRKLRIAIDCRIHDPRQGIGTAVLALARALSDTRTTDQEYTFIVRQPVIDWLQPYIHGPCRLVGIPVPNPAPESPVTRLKAAVGKIRPLQKLWHRMQKRSDWIPRSDGFVERNGFDLVHFPTQTAYLTRIPSIYQPWDLQHLHYPDFFAQEVISAREREYRTFCDQATYVCVQAEWTRDDVIRQYQLPQDKVVVIPWGSVLEAYDTPAESLSSVVRAKYRIPKQYFFYPAVTWPHKNHAVILRALHQLKTKDRLAPHVYFTGRQTSQKPKLDELAAELGVSEQVHFLGFLPPDELQVLLGGATAMLFPSRFEGFGLPLLEAFHAGTPVICSNATTLPEIAGDAAFYFEPDDASKLAFHLKVFLCNPEVRDSLIRNGKSMLARHSIAKTANAFQALYAAVAESTARLTIHEANVVEQVQNRK